MKHGFNHIDDYNKYRPQVGSYNLRFNPHDYLDEARSIYNSPNAKFSGYNNFNRFNSVSNDTKKYLSQYWNKQFNLDYDWNWEYFHSGEPAGLHTDYLSLPNIWNANNGVITQDCFVVLGIIIPLEWNCKQPYTVNYNRYESSPRKAVYRKDQMRYIDNDEVINYRTHGLYDDEVAKYNPKQTQYNRLYQDLKVHSVYEWKLGTAMIFDTKRWHSSSWFLSDDNFPEVSTEYKRAIIGFASIDVDRINQ